MKYRICENKYGYFKIQKWHPPYKVWKIFPIKGEWLDLKGYGSGVYDKKCKIDIVLNLILEEEREKNQYWQCIEYKSTGDLT